jgi:hypothetical protein
MQDIRKRPLKRLFQRAFKIKSYLLSATAAGEQKDVVEQGTDGRNS